jgi:hypothetical protein
VAARGDDESQDICVAYGSFQFKGIEGDEELHGIFPSCLRSFAAACADPFRKPVCSSSDDATSSLTASPRSLCESASVATD